uniref:Sulfotransferase domain-containing protein n=1 Tax=Arion vulgaris TaxID=1028688 RepID=A0A0B7B115_9EUPU
MTMTLLVNLTNCLLRKHYSSHVLNILAFIPRTNLHNSVIIKYRPQAILLNIACLSERGLFSYFCQKNLEASVKPCYVSRFFSSSVKGNSFKFDQKQESRRQKLLLLTYFSGFIGTCLLCAIGFRQYAVFSRRAQGIEELRVREYGRSPHLFRYRGYVLPDFVISDVQGIHTYDVREDDVWVVGFPKAGITWLQEIVYLIVNDADFKTASEIKIEDRFPYFEYIFPGKKSIDKMVSPRLIKTHLPLSLLPNQIAQKKPKIIYIARNPKDTVVSYFHFVTKFLSGIGQSFNGTFEKYCELFVDDLVHYGPWWKHVKEAWDRRDDDNVLVLFYEDLQLDLQKTVLDIAQFLEKPITAATAQAIVQHCSFESMKNNKSVNYDWMKDEELARKDASFMRKGEVGDWKNHLSADVIQKLDEIVATKLSPADIPIRDSLPKKN